MDFAGVLDNALTVAFGPLGAVYALLAIGLNLHYGYTGMLNFGQVGYMLVGAYGIGITTVTLGWSLWLGVHVAMGFSIILSFLLGGPTLRLRTDYFAITTIAAAEVLRIVARSSVAEPLTGGPFGLQAIANDFYAVNPLPRARYGVGFVNYSETTFWVMIVSWGLVALFTVAVWLLMRSPWGRVVKSIREDEDAALSLGKNVFSYKMQSLILGGLIGSFGGMMFAISGSTVNADSYMPVVTFFAYTILILGGAASTFGPIIGAMIFWFLASGLDALLRQMASQDLLPGFLSGENIGSARFILVGLGLVLLMVFRPEGMFGNRREMQLDV